MLDFIKENFNLIAPLIVFVTGWLLPAPKFFEFGKKVAKKMPPSLAKLIAERLDALEKGLLEHEVKGNKDLVDNESIKNELKRVRLDLGLKE